MYPTPLLAHAWGIEIAVCLLCVGSHLSEKILCFKIRQPTAVASDILGYWCELNLQRENGIWLQYELVMRWPHRFVMVSHCLCPESARNQMPLEDKLRGIFLFSTMSTAVSMWDRFVLLWGMIEGSKVTLLVTVMWISGLYSTHCLYQRLLLPMYVCFFFISYPDVFLPYGSYVSSQAYEMDNFNLYGENRCLRIFSHILRVFCTSALSVLEMLPPDDNTVGKSVTYRVCPSIHNTGISLNYRPLFWTFIVIIGVSGGGVGLVLKTQNHSSPWMESMDY